MPNDALRETIGGVGLGVQLLLRESPAGIDPLAPDASLVIALSPLVGTPLTTSAKFAVVAKSPLTSRISDALASDRFAMELKYAGMDALVITGAAPSWSLLIIDDDKVSLKPAPHLVGLSSDETETKVRAEWGDAFRFFGIGPAGEHLVRYATISGDGRHAGRGGLGAVLGAKKLKGIAVRGTSPAALHDRDRVLALAKDLSERSMGAATRKYRELGTVANVLVMNRMGSLPTRNFQRGSFDGADAISGEAFHQTKGRVRAHCAACTIGCEHLFKSKDGRSVRLEYEGIFALGPLLGISDRETVLLAARTCDDLGLDVISAGGTIAFAMECRERGLLPDAPAFGDRDGALALLQAIGTRSGALGDLLANGSRSAAKIIGKGSERFACHVKGMELPGYEPRALQSMALGLAVGARGADHNRSGAYEEDFRAGGKRLVATVDKGPAAARSEDRAALIDSMILCKFLRGVFDDLPAECATMLAAVTGWDVTADELVRTAQRVVTLKKLFNLREGWTQAEDTLPARFLSEPLDCDGDAEGTTLTKHDLDAMIGSYYRARGWTLEGVPTKASLRALDVVWPMPSTKDRLE